MESVDKNWRVTAGIWIVVLFLFADLGLACGSVAVRTAWAHGTRHRGGVSSARISSGIRRGGSSRPLLGPGELQPRLQLGTGDQRNQVRPTALPFFPSFRHRFTAPVTVHALIAILGHPQIDLLPPGRQMFIQRRSRRPPRLRMGTVSDFRLHTVTLGSHSRHGRYSQPIGTFTHCSLHWLSK